MAKGAAGVGYSAGRSVEVHDPTATLSTTAGGGWAVSAMRHRAASDEGAVCRLCGEVAAAWGSGAEELAGR